MREGSRSRPALLLYVVNSGITRTVLGSVLFPGRSLTGFSIRGTPRHIWATHDTYLVRGSVGA